MVKITYVEYNGLGHTVDVPVGNSVMEGAKANGIPGIDADCGGACACATCHVHVGAQWQEATGNAGEFEKELLEFASGADQFSRLSCQIKLTEALDGLIVNLPETQR